MENKVMPHPASHSFPTEIITLPSKGLLYPAGSELAKGTIEMRYMTAKHEDILTNESYISSGVVIDKLIEALVVSPVDLDDLLLGDKNAILVASRVLGYGKDYQFTFSGEEVEVDLATLTDKELDASLITDGKNEFLFESGATKISFKLLNQKDENAISEEIEGLKKIYGDNVSESVIRLKRQILAVNGHNDAAYISDYVENHMLARDARAFRSYVNKVSPDVNLVFDFQGKEYPMPIQLNFFYPEA
ncbi:hypothetical protein OAA15_00240 [bacterium]|nr:hypothetical protein [bacterium]